MLDLIQQFGAQPPWVIAWQVFANGGWVAFLIIFLAMARLGWLQWRENIYFAKQKFILLAIDIPSEHTQSPKAVEQIFASLLGSHKKMNFKERYLEGRFVLSYSFEIVSIEGYVQFLVHVPATLRDVVEAAIYAQYPDSEIVEVHDYTKSVPKVFPAEGWKLWGAEITNTKNSVYPIRTYPAFEHTMTQRFADPLADLLELLSRMGPGEQFWLQFVIVPISDAWHQKSQKEAKKLAGQVTAGESNFLKKIFSPVIELIVDIFKQGLGGEASAMSTGNGDTTGLYSKMFSLTPGERNLLEAIQNKASKPGFEAKVRFMYVAKEENFNPAKGVSGFFGAMKQFAILDGNSFKPHPKAKTTANYFLVKKRLANKSNKLLRGYRNRSVTAGGGTGRILLNIEELATLWHFPNEEIKAPQLKRSDSRLVEPPASLPVASSLMRIQPVPRVSVERSGEKTTDSEVPHQPAKPFVQLEGEFESGTFSESGPAGQAGSLGPPTNLPTG